MMPEDNLVSCAKRVTVTNRPKNHTINNQLHACYKHAPFHAAAVFLLEGGGGGKKTRQSGVVAV